MDLGCGRGVFTRALASLLGNGSKVFAVDKAPQQIDHVEGVEIRFVKADFVGDKLPVAKADGILMANSLHYVKDKARMLAKVRDHLKDKGLLIVVEYERSRSNAWVPFPVRFSELNEICVLANFQAGKLIGERPSLYGPEMMYACSFQVVKD